MGGSSSKPQTTTQINEPPAYLRPYLQETAGAASDIYKSSAPAYFPSSTVVPLAPETTTGLGNITNLATQGGQLTPAATQTLLSTIRGENQVNPFLAGAVKAANQPILDTFRQQTIPELSSIFARTGGTGGSAEGFGAERAATALGRGLAEQSAGMAYRSAEDERARQLQATQLAPSIDAARFADAQALLGVGGAKEAQSQVELQAQIDKYNYEQNLPSLKLNQYIAQLASGGSGRGITTTSASKSEGSPWLSRLGGAASGAAMGSVFGPWGTAIGAYGGYVAGGGSPFGLGGDIGPEQGWW